MTPYSYQSPLTFDQFRQRVRRFHERVWGTTHAEFDEVSTLIYTQRKVHLDAYYM